MYGSEFLLDRYITLGNPEPLIKNGMQYSIQRYQGKHKDEFLLRSGNGDILLFENNVLKQYWQENEDGKKSEEFTRYKNGRVDFTQRFDYILDQMNSKRIVYHKRGLRMEIWSSQTGHLLYHGEFNERRMREGWGIEYDEESGNVVVEGIWNRGILKEVIRLFNGNTMTELKRNGEDSLDPTKRIPMYVGGFRYDEENERFIREGVGCLIEAQSGIATRESVWKDGEEVSGVDLFDGYFNPSPLQVTVYNPKDLRNISFEVTDLVISSNCCNEMIALNLNRFVRLRNIEIGDNCFSVVKQLRIDGLNRLKTLSIGKNSFTEVKQMLWDQKWEEAQEKANNSSKSFFVMNCQELELITINEYSFCDFGGKFELKNLPSLHTLRIGNLDGDSWNFVWSSFVIRSTLRFPVLRKRSSEAKNADFRI